MLLVRQTGNVVESFAHAGTGEWLEAPCGYLRYFGFGDIHRSDAHEVMEKVERYFVAAHVSAIRAGLYGYLLPGDTFTDDSSAALLILLQRGYQIVYGSSEYCLSDLKDWPEPAPDIDVEILVEIGQGELPNQRIKMSRFGREIGASWSFSSWHHGPSLHDQSRCIIGDVDIVEEHQGTGLGRFLLEYTLHAISGLGYKSVGLKTGIGNLRARYMYTDIGFRFVGVSHQMVKDLTASEPDRIWQVPLYGYPSRWA